MKLFDMYKERKYFGLTGVLAVFMFFFYPWVQSLGIQVDLWYRIITLPSLALFIVFSLVFGMFVSFQVKQMRGPRVCSVKQASGRSAAGIIGTILGFFVGVCPACIGFAGLLLPLATVTFLVVFGPVFMLLSIGLMVLSIHLNRGFRK